VVRAKNKDIYYIGIFITLHELLWLPRTFVNLFCKEGTNYKKYQIGGMFKKKKI